MFSSLTHVRHPCQSLGWVGCLHRCLLQRTYNLHAWAALCR